MLRLKQAPSDSRAREVIDFLAKDIGEAYDDLRASEDL